MTNHAGTHVDAPLHFFDGGGTVDGYGAAFWLCHSVALLDASVASPGQIISPEDCQALDSVDEKTELVLVRTGFERYRALHGSAEVSYAKRGPGLSPAWGDWLRSFGSVRFLGFDFVSASSYLHREIGRDAHRALLRPDHPILLIEDMMLARLTCAPRKVLVAPLRIEQGDGAPVTVFAWIEDPV